MAGPAATVLLLSAGSFPHARCNPVASVTRPSLLMVANTQPCVVLRRFAPASPRKCVAAAGHGRQELRASQYQFDDDEPLWLAVVRDVAAGLRGFVAFLAEQPKQLKHLEWPGFRNTVCHLHKELICRLGSSNMSIRMIKLCASYQIIS
ncbi:hypothetical protein GUJ93_ZPchr0002g26687 [Zizania palustris]|uniref:Uncharacterized protein n=1 Tax=Zizania palustris TaxID=103762 RepID=A0A8J5RZ85_ZIZPA|nr:hypothetical protein GUJ93_ZPchr0002g26687 [Zizania palustris]KAG8056940.1 hypothetical protein GUJ93_ZPchr0002g26687 [Zizania palustris]